MRTTARTSSDRPQSWLLALLAGLLAFWLGLQPVQAAPLAAVATSPLQQGIAAYQDGHYGPAIAAFSQAIAGDEPHAAAYSNRCLVRLQLADYEGAIADCLVALHLRPTNGEARLNLGLAQYQLANYDVALANFDRRLALQPDDPRAYFNRGLVQFARRDYEQAIADYTQALAIHSPDDRHCRAMIYNERSLAYLARTDVEAARADLDAAIALDAAVATTAYFSRARLHRLAGNWNAALRDYDRLLALAPEQAQAYYQRALLHRQLGNRAAAIADFSQAARQFRTQGRETAYQHSRLLLQQLRTRPVATG